MEALGKKLGFMQSQKNFHNVSLGQGQEVVAEEAMEVAARDVVLAQFQKDLPFINQLFLVNHDQIYLDLRN